MMLDITRDRYSWYHGAKYSNDQLFCVWKLMLVIIYQGQLHRSVQMYLFAMHKKISYDHDDEPCFLYRRVATLVNHLNLSTKEIWK